MMQQPAALALPLLQPLNVTLLDKRQFTDGQRLVYGLLGLLLCGFITLVNSAVFAVFLRSRGARKTPGHVLIVGLMVTSDIMIGATALPGYLLDTLFDTWPLPLWLCDLWITCDYTSTNVSVVSVTAVAFDRFLATNCVFAHKRWMHRANQVRLCVALWVFTAARNVATFPVWVLATRFRESAAAADALRCSHPIYRNPTAALVQRTLALYIPIILLVFFYAAVVLRILRSARSGQGGATSDALLRRNVSIKREALHGQPRQQPAVERIAGGRRSQMGRLAKSFRIVTCVLVSFLLANLPWHVLDNMIMMKRTAIRKTDSVYIMSWIMCYMNAFLNPFFYLFMNDNYKSALLGALRCRCPGRWRDPLPAANGPAGGVTRHNSVSIATVTGASIPPVSETVREAQVPVLCVTQLVSSV